MNVKNKLILAYGMLCGGIYLQSCSSIGSNKHNITPIQGSDLLSNNLLKKPEDRTLKEEGQPLIQELRKKIRRLKDQGFIEGRDNNNDNIKKHFMFVFYHCLCYKQTTVNWDTKAADLKQIMESPSARGLLWTPVFINRDTNRIITRFQTLDPKTIQLQFRLNALYNEQDDLCEENTARGQIGRAPQMEYDGLAQDIHIDHLFRDNHFTIEIPKDLHQEKTEIIDNLIFLSKEKPERSSTNYWRWRTRR